MNTKIILSLAIFLAFTLHCQSSLEDILAPLPVLAEASPALVARKTSEEKEIQKDGNVLIEKQNPISESTMEEVQPIVVALDQQAYPITGDDLLLAIEEKLHEELRPSGRISLAPMRKLPDLSKHSQPFKVRISGYPGRLSRNSMQLKVQVENEKGILGNWDIPFRPRLYSEVWFAKTNLRKGNLATVSDFEARRVDLLLEPDAVVASLEVLQRHEYSRDVRPGQPLEWTDLVERSLVRKGQVVDVIAYQGMIGISMRAKAQQDGVRGDMVFLRNLESNKDFTGEVVGEGRVQVTF